MSRKSIIVCAIFLILLVAAWQTALHSGASSVQSTTYQSVPPALLAQAQGQVQFPTTQPLAPNAVIASNPTPDTTGNYSADSSSKYNYSYNYNNTGGSSYNPNLNNLNNMGTLDTTNINSFYSWSSTQPTATVSNWQQNYSTAMKLSQGQAAASSKVTALVGAVWQRDPTQYANENDYKLWSPSTCSAAATASVLAAFGYPVKISQVLAVMESNNGISPVSGLMDNGDFNIVAQRYGLHAILDENHNLDAHFNSILNQLRANQPVIINVQDSTFFPNGHFMVAYHLNADGSIAVMNSDPAPGTSVYQNWSPSLLKLEFSRTMRSVLFAR